MRLRPTSNCWIENMSKGPHPSKRDLEKRIDALEGDSDDGDPQEVPDLSLSVEEKDELEQAFDVEPATMKKP